MTQSIKSDQLRPINFNPHSHAGSDEEEAEDNFMDALNGTAAEVWEESEIEEDDVQ